GTQPFCELDIITRPPVLIPRWETEEWASRLCEVIRSNWQPSAGSLRILDVCTGTGCIALTLASQLPENSVEICALDISSDAIVLARENYAVHASRIQNQVQFHLCDIYDEPLPVTGDFDCVIANPPYITGQEYSDLDADVKQWEDKRALYAAENGTAVHRRIIDVASRLTQPKWNIPRVIMEIGGSHQIESLAATLKSHHFTDIEVWQDLAGKDRVILAK
ncbi:S-adenosyl-L-methionine-dependent methyltransferase, partial [Radiomyces spectabilis]|uniref:S-adenosyl-L-methionine-dependent methyltransferase n=1 Tax=Radiomyces spectabilis TaxID=64574 RepID=UPI00221EE469